jgi:acyl dehydratase
MTSGTSPATPVAEGLNRDVIGKRYRSPAELMRPELGLAYAAATNDPSPSYSGDGAVTPPLLSVRQLWTVAKQVVLDPEARVDMLHLVHGEQDMHFHSPIRPWDLIAARAEIVGIEDKASGQILSVHQRLMREGEVVVEATSAYFIKGKPTGDKPPAAPKAPPPPPPVREWLFESTFTVDADQSYRYAAASLDDNPIHIDEATAKGAGFPSVILHGLATMAMTGREVVNHVTAGDGTRLRRYKVRFARPVLPGDTLTVRSFAISKTDTVLTVGVETVNQRGDIVIAAGLLEFTA